MWFLRFNLVNNCAVDCSLVCKWWILWILDVELKSSAKTFYYAKSWKRFTKNNSIHSSFLWTIGQSYRDPVFATISEFCIPAKLIMDPSLPLWYHARFQTRQSIIMRHLQLRHGKCSAESGSTSQWQYFSKIVQLLAFYSVVEQKSIKVVLVVNENKVYVINK